MHLHCYSWTGVGDDRCKGVENYRAAERYFLCGDDEARIGLNLRLPPKLTGNPGFALSASIAAHVLDQVITEK